MGEKGAGLGGGRKIRMKMKVKIQIKGYCQLVNRRKEKLGDMI